MVNHIGEAFLQVLVLQLYRYSNVIILSVSGNTGSIVINDNSYKSVIMLVLTIQEMVITNLATLAYVNSRGFHSNIW